MTSSDMSRSADLTEGELALMKDRDRFAKWAIFFGFLCIVELLFIWVLLSGGGVAI